MFKYEGGGPAPGQLGGGGEGGNGRGPLTAIRQSWSPHNHTPVGRGAAAGGGWNTQRRRLDRAAVAVGPRSGGDCTAQRRRLYRAAAADGTRMIPPPPPSLIGTTIPFALPYATLMPSSLYDPRWSPPENAGAQPPFAGTKRPSRSLTVKSAKKYRYRYSRVTVWKDYDQLKH